MAVNKEIQNLELEYKFMPEKEQAIQDSGKIAEHLIPRSTLSLPIDPNYRERKQRLERETEERLAAYNLQLVQREAEMDNNSTSDSSDESDSSSSSESAPPNVHVVVLWSDDSSDSSDSALPDSSEHDTESNQSSPTTESSESGNFSEPEEFN